MEPQTVRQILEESLRELVKKDGHLFENDVNERTIAARLAIYLQPRFPEYSVDADYNRDGNRPKRLAVLTRECDGYRNEKDESLAVPDLIVHRRGPGGPNLLVLEIKKTTNRDKGGCDRFRLLAFREQLGYTYGALIICETRKGRSADAAITEWLEDGWQ